MFNTFLQNGLGNLEFSKPNFKVDSPKFTPTFTPNLGQLSGNPYMSFNVGIAERKPSAIQVTLTTTETSTETGTNTDKTESKSLVGSKLNAFGQDIIKNSELQNLMFGMATNMLPQVLNSSGVDTTFLIGDLVANILPGKAGLIAKGAMFGIKAINSLGGKKSDAFSANLDTIEEVGSSYGGSVNTINDAASKAGKKYGLFSNSKRKKANRLIAEARKLQNIMTNIANEAEDLKSMTGDLANYINYESEMNGGYDLRYMRAAKHGMKLLDKINFIKQKRSINNFINLNTKELDWEPIIEFKQGGTIEKSWEPIITQQEESCEKFELGGPIAENWEPVIKQSESFKTGGIIKDTLETPEIEETTQKNLIPEGALHKNKHHMEHTEGLTLKGIPVIDNDGDQQAEIELDEIIFTLEVTKKLEELYKDFYDDKYTQKEKDDFAIEAGKLLVKEILFNTDDRTGLIAKCEKGGILNEVS